MSSDTVFPPAGAVRRAAHGGPLDGGEQGDPRRGRPRAAHDAGYRDGAAHLCQRRDQ